MCLNYLNQMEFEFCMGLCRELVSLESVISRCPEFKYLNFSVDEFCSDSCFAFDSAAVGPRPEAAGGG